MRNRATFILLLLHVLPSPAERLGAPPTSVREIEASVQIHLNRLKIHVGDPITYTVFLSLPKGAEIVGARGIRLSGSEFVELSSRLDNRPREKDGRLLRKDTYEITCFATGEKEIPPYRVSYRAPSGEMQSVTSRWGDLAQVESVLRSPDESLSEIRPLLEWEDSGMPASLRLIILTGLLLGTALLVALLEMLKNRPSERVQTRPSVPPHERALAALESLRSGEAVTSGDRDRFSVELSAIIRRYVEDRFRIPAPDCTTSETLDGLRRLPDAAEHLESLKRLLQICDLGKFAGLFYRLEEPVALVDRAEEWVKTTIPNQDLVREDRSGSANHAERGGIPPPCKKEDED